MHCPSCGNESSLEQKFCRTCGFNLGPVSELVRGAPESSESIKRRRREREALAARQMFRWLGWGMAILGIGVVMLVAQKTFDMSKLFRFVSTMVILGGVAIAMYGTLAVVGKSGPAAPKAGMPDHDKELPAADTNELPEARIPISLPSVTERTTQLIGEEKVNNSNNG